MRDGKGSSRDHPGQGGAIGARLADPERLAAIERSGLLDAPPEEAFDRLTRVAALVLDAPVALIALLTADRHLLKSQVGLDPVLAEAGEVPISHSICKHVVASGRPLLLDDAREDALFREHPGVRDYGVLAYAGVPLEDAEGHCLGAFCVVDTRPRQWTERDLRLLDDLATVTTTEMRLRAATEEAHRAREVAADGRAYATGLIDALNDGVAVVDEDGVLTDVNLRLCEMTGFAREELVGIGFPFPFAVPGMPPEAFAEMRRQVREAGTGTFIVPMRRKDDSGLTAEIAVRRITDLGGRPADVVAFRDVSERLRLEERAHAGEAINRSLIAAMAEGVVVQGADGAIVASNPAAEQILGMTLDQMRGLTSLDPRWRAVHEDGSPFPGEAHPAMVALRTGRPVHGVIMGVHKPDGDLTWIQISSEPVAALGDGGGQAVVTTFTDVTAMRRIQDDLQRSEELLRRVSDQAPAGIYVTDEKGACTWVSAAWSEITGISPEDALGDGWIPAVHPDDLARLWPDYEATMRDGVPFAGEYRVVRPDGHTTWVTTRVTPLRDSTGAMAGLVGVMADSTRDRFFDVSQDLLSIVAEDGRFVRMNQAFRDLLGLSTEEALALSLTDVVHPEDEAAARAVLAAAADGQPEAALETRCRAADGTSRRLAWSIARDPASGYLHAIARDVTEARRAAETEAALLRVSSVLAEGRSPQSLFQAVAKEVAALLGADAAAVMRFDGAMSVMVGVVGPARLNRRLPNDGDGAVAAVYRTGAPARWTLPEDGPPSPMSEFYAEVGLRTAIAVPVVVRGELWGAIVVAHADPRAFLADETDRLARFANLVEAAISTAEARREIVEYAAEQAALRRVATLVAQEGDPGQVFELVAEEAASLLAADACGVLRLEPGGAEGRVVSWWAMPGLAAPGAGSMVRFRGGSLHEIHLGALPPPDELASWLLPDMPDDNLECRFAAPVVVNGRLWGAVLIGTATRQLEPRSQERLQRFAELVGLAIASADARAQLAEMASTDHLTGLWNRRAFDERIEMEVARARRHRRPLSLIVLDLDHFKNVNDAHGHQVGDRVLAELAERLRRVSRAGEVVARVGGEEFAWLLPESDGAAALAAAERARAAIAAERFPIIGHLTSSAGVCELANAGTASELFRLADLALYWAKAQGRDASFLYTPAALEVIHADEQARRIDRARALAAIQVLAQAVDARDSSTQRHSERVATLAERLALTAGWTPERARMLHEAGLVHDVGKVGVPDLVLFKPGLLDDSEREVVRQHVALGTLMVGGSLAGEQVSWIRGHHERWDGAGYPDGLAADRIPEGARLLAVADAWDAMTVARSHSTPRTVEDALEEVRRESGRQFCPSAVATLEELWRASPEALMPPPGLPAEGAPTEAV